MRGGAKLSIDSATGGVLARRSASSLTPPRALTRATAARPIPRTHASPVLAGRRGQSPQSNEKKWGRLVAPEQAGLVLGGCRAELEGRSHGPPVTAKPEPAPVTPAGRPLRPPLMQRRWGPRRPQQCRWARPPTGRQRWARWRPPSLASPPLHRGHAGARIPTCSDCVARRRERRATNSDFANPTRLAVSRALRTKRGMPRVAEHLCPSARKSIDAHTIKRSKEC